MRAVNLIPSDQRSGGAVATRSGGAAYLVLGLLGGLVVLALLYGRSHDQLESRRAEAVTLSARAQQVQEQAAQLAPYAAFMAIREQRLHAITQLVGARFDWPNAMGELSRVLPRDVALQSLQGTIGAASPTTSGTPAAAAAAATAVSSATPPGATPTFTLTGCATSQSVVAQMLVRLRLISGVSSVTLQSSTKSSGSSGSCSGNDPVFNLQVLFQPLPSAPEPSIQALTSTTATAANTHTSSAKTTAAATATGATR